MKLMFLAIAALIAPVATPAQALTPRDTLAQAAFFASDKAAALAQISSAESAASAMLAKAPSDVEAAMTRAMATGYLAKLNHSRKEALEAKAQFEALVARDPRNPEAQAALGGWHLGAVASLGGMLARGGLGAKKTAGLEATERAVALGGDRALFQSLAALMRLEIDPGDPRGAQLAEGAAHGSTPTAIDKIMQHRAVLVLAAIKAGNASLVQALAKRLLPLGQLKL